MLVTFVLALILEHAATERLILMATLFVLFFVWVHLRDLFHRQFERFLSFSFAVDIVILILLDYHSKYVVNYYINVYYFFVLIAAGFIPHPKKRLIASFVIILAAFIKYYRLTEIYTASFVLSYLFFTLMVFVTTAFFFNYSRMLSEERSRLDSLNRDLKHANELLEEKNRKIKELAVYEERNRIAREIHDSVGHNLTGLIMNLDLCSKLADLEPAGVSSQLFKCKEIARECLGDIRRSVQALKPQSVEILPLVKSIEELVSEAKQKFNIAIYLDVKGNIFNTVPDFNIVVYRAIQEAITNSVRHGHATRVDVVINYTEPEFSLFIKDNGTGAKNFTPGNGLTGMIERTGEFGGSINFFKNDGFMINISVPAGNIRG